MTKTRIKKTSFRTGNKKTTIYTARNKYNKDVIGVIVKDLETGEVSAGSKKAGKGTKI